MYNLIPGVLTIYMEKPEIPRLENQMVRAIPTKEASAGNLDCNLI